MQGKLKIYLPAAALLILLHSGCRKAGLPDQYHTGCPKGMAAIPGMNVCIDRYEASLEDRDGKDYAISRKGVQPASNTSFMQAEAACKNAGKRLCKLNEWYRACEGAEKRTYPYGSKFKKKACNCVYLYKDPTTSGPKPAGSMPECKTPEGVYDLSGNLWEWIDEQDQTGKLRLLRGGGYSNQDYLLHCRTKSNSYQPLEEAHRGYGFRCCKEKDM